MQTVYLKDGTQANLIAKIEKGFVVDPIKIYHDHEGEEEYNEPSGDVMMVEKVYETAPKELIQEEYKDILLKVEEQEKVLADKREEIRKLDREVANLKNTKTDTSRYIINREQLRTAKRLILWPTNSIAPRIMDGGSSHKFTVSYEISQYKNEERAWCYKLWEENKSNSWSSSEYFDEQYGIKTDLTDEQILHFTHQRISRFKKDFHSWENVLLRTDDSWLTPEYILLKSELKDKARQNALIKAKQEVEKAQAELVRLQNEVTVS